MGIVYEVVAATIPNGRYARLCGYVPRCQNRAILAVFLVQQGRSLRHSELVLYSVAQLVDERR
jgi:hypothetical protein